MWTNEDLEEENEAASIGIIDCTQKKRGSARHTRAKQNVSKAFEVKSKQKPNTFEAFSQVNGRRMSSWDVEYVVA